MERNKRDCGRGAPSAVTGVLLVAFGSLLLLDRFGVLDFGRVLHFWPVLLVVYGLFAAVTAQNDSSRIFGGLVALAGGVMVAQRLGLTSIYLWDLWPLAIIAVGLTLLWNTLYASKLPRANADGSNMVEGWAVFGGSEIRNSSNTFEGGDLLAVFGGYKLDLRKASMKGEEVVLTANAIFGGVELRVPQDWTVQLRGSPIFGGFEDKTVHPESNPLAPRRILTIRGMAIFGGVEVKN